MSRDSGEAPSPSSFVSVRPPEPTEAPRPAFSARFLLLVAVFLTGATSLAYEIAWSRALVLVLGSTATTTALVLAAFVGALGLGARWGGRRADARERPLLLYGLLEVGAAVWAVLALPLVGLLEGPYVNLAGGLPETARLLPRALAAALVVMPGAFLLGATLPALVRWWVGGRGGAGRGTAWVYGVNTLGAVLGALGTGFFLIEALGVGGALALAAGVAAFVGLLAAFAGWNGPVTPTSAPSRVPASVPLPRGAPLGLTVRGASLAALATGALGLGIEVAGFRLLVFFVEGFTVTFAAMLGVFIAGLALGSLLLGPWLTRGLRPDRMLGYVLVPAGIAMGAVLMVVVGGGLEETLANVKAWAYGRAGFADPIATGLRWTALAGSALVFLVPAVFLGATFPLCVRWAETAGLPAGRAVGRVYLFNSLGSILAPILVGFVLIPLVSVGTTWQILGQLAAATGVFLLLGRPTVRFVFAVTVLAVIVLHAAVSERSLVVEASHVLAGHPERKLLEVRTDPITTASVVEDGHGQRILYTDDFAAAATGRHYRYMRMLGHLPVLLAENPANTMVIAFGTGTTAGAVAAHDEVKRIEVVEVSDAVLQLASYFTKANRKVLEDPRTVVVRDDGRNALLLHDDALDVITLEPLMPYSPAGLPFYTKEFYELCRDRLNDGGVLCQWVPVHAMPAWLYAAFVRTFFEVFPEGDLYFFEQSSALIWKKGDGPLDPSVLRRRLDAAHADLEQAGLADADAFLATFVASGRTVLEAPEPDSPFAGRTVRDLDPYPEFHPTPRAPLNTTFLRDTIAWLATLAGPTDLPPGMIEGDDAARLRGAARGALIARARDADATFLAVQRRARPALLPEVLRAWDEAAEAYALAHSMNPGDRVLVWRRSRADRRAARLRVQILASRARRERVEGRPGQARVLLREAAAVARDAVDQADGDPLASERGPMVGAYASVLLRLGRCRQAVALLAESMDVFPASRARDELAAFHEVAERWGRTGRKPSRGPFAELLADLPPCIGEGTEPVKDALARYREALEAGGPRRLQAAGDALIQQARAEEVGGAVAVEASGWPVPLSPPARASWSGVIASLDEAKGDRLGGLLVHEDPPMRIASVREAGRLRLLRRHPKTAEALAGADEADVRAALAEAAGADGDRALLRLVPNLLLDPVRDVRLAAVSVLVPRFPDEMAAYDPDGSEASRREVAEKIRARLS